MSEKGSGAGLGTLVGVLFGALVFHGLKQRTEEPDRSPPSNLQRLRMEEKEEVPEKRRIVKPWRQYN